MDRDGRLLACSPEARDLFAELGVLDDSGRRLATTVVQLLWRRMSPAASSPQACLISGWEARGSGVLFWSPDRPGELTLSFWPVETGLSIDPLWSRLLEGPPDESQASFRLAA